MNFFFRCDSMYIKKTYDNNVFITMSQTHSPLRILFLFCYLLAYSFNSFETYLHALSSAEIFFFFLYCTQKPTACNQIINDRFSIQVAP